MYNFSFVIVEVLYRKDNSFAWWQAAILLSLIILNLLLVLRHEAFNGMNRRVKSWGFYLVFSLSLSFLPWVPQSLLNSIIHLSCNYGSPRKKKPKMSLRLILVRSLALLIVQAKGVPAQTSLYCCLNFVYLSLQTNCDWVADDWLRILVVGLISSLLHLRVLL